jgi:hypothetical protein
LPDNSLESASLVNITGIIRWVRRAHWIIEAINKKKINPVITPVFRRRKKGAGRFFK